MALKLASDREDLAIAHEMNVTPFIDVMLVLLVVFMIAAPLSTVEVKVDLPASSAAASPSPERPIVITLPVDGGLKLDGRDVAAEALGDALLAAAAGDRNARIHLQADRRLRYERLMAAMDRIRDAGFLRIALVGVEGPTPH